MPKNSLVICWVLFLVLTVPLGLSGCASEVSAQQISSNTINNITPLYTTGFTATMHEVFEVIGGSEPGNLTVFSNTIGSMNWVSREGHLTMDMSMDGPGVEGKQNMSGDMYFTGGWIYMKASVPGEGEQWIKQKLSDDAWTSENKIGEQADNLKTAHNLTKLGAEKVDDIDCYIIQCTPEMNALMKSGIVDQLNGFFDLNSIDFDVKSVDWDKIVKYISMKLWIAKDNYLPIKVYADVLLEILPQDLGNTTMDMDRMTINISQQFKYYDYNKPVVIQLPPEAQNAEELPPI